MNSWVLEEKEGPDRATISHLYAVNSGTTKRFNVSSNWVLKTCDPVMKST